jgi:hypothetical protein
VIYRRRAEKGVTKDEAGTERFVVPNLDLLPPGLLESTALVDAREKPNWLVNEWVECNPPALQAT